MRHLKREAPRPYAGGRILRLLRAHRRRVLVCALGVGAVGGIALAASELRGALGELSGESLAWTASLGLVLADVQVEGRKVTEREEILAALGARPGMPLLAIAPDAAKARLEALPWVHSAAVERRLPDTILVRLAERRPLALWQNQGRFELLDEAGAVIKVARPEHRFGGLPLVVGPDAPEHAPGFIETLRSAPELFPRVAAAIRIGGRRWNVRMTNGVEIQLPEIGAAEAWAQLARMDRTGNLLARNIEAVDLRLPDRLVVRTIPEPPAAAPPSNKKKTSARPT